MWWFFLGFASLSLKGMYSRLLLLTEILTCYNELNNIVPSHKENKHLCISLEHMHFWKLDANQGLNLLIWLRQNFCSTCLARFTAKLSDRSHKQSEGLCQVRRQNCWFYCGLCSCELGRLVAGPILETVYHSNTKSTVDHGRWDSGKSRSHFASPSRLTF